MSYRPTVIHYAPDPGPHANKPYVVDEDGRSVWLAEFFKLPPADVRILELERELAALRRVLEE